MRRTLLAVGAVALLVTGLYGCAGMQDDAGLQQQVQDFMAQQQIDTKVTGSEGGATVTEEADVAVASAGPAAAAMMPKMGKYFEKFKSACFVEKALWYALDKKDYFSFAVFNYDAFKGDLDRAAKYFQDAGVDMRGPVAAYTAVAGDSDIDIDNPYLAAFTSDMDSDAGRVWYFAFVWDKELGDDVVKKIWGAFSSDSDSDFQYDKFFYDGVGYVHLFSNGDVFTDFFAKFKDRFSGEYQDFGDGDQDCACAYWSGDAPAHYMTVPFVLSDRPLDATAFFSYKGAFAKYFAGAALSDFRSIAKMDSDAGFDFEKVIATRGIFSDKKAAVVFSGLFEGDWKNEVHKTADYYDLVSDYDLIKNSYDKAFAVATFGRFFATKAGDVQQLAPAGGTDVRANQ